MQDQKRQRTGRKRGRTGTAEAYAGQGAVIRHRNGQRKQERQTSAGHRTAGRQQDSRQGVPDGIA